jgi:transposase-like protein
VDAVLERMLIALGKPPGSYAQVFDVSENTIKTWKRRGAVSLKYLEAFAAIERAIKHEFGVEPIQIKFESWPQIEIRLEGKGYEGTITADMAGALVELQHAMNRAYARMVHQSTNARSLTDVERGQLQFKAKVENGSSLIKVDLGEYAEKLVVALADKMTPEHIVIAVIGTAAVAGSTLAYKWFLQHKTEGKKIEEGAKQAIAMSQEETKRLEVFAKAVAQHPQLENARQDFDEARTEMVRGTSDAYSLSVNGVKLDRESARVVSMTKRSESKEIQLNGTYIILKADWEQDNEVRLKISNADNKREFYASFKDESLGGEQIELLKAAEWNRDYVYLSINATELRGEVTTATIIGVHIQPLQAAVPV